MTDVLGAMIGLAVDAYPLRDPEVVRAAQAGDERALEVLLTTLADELMPLASALTGGDVRADELVGDTLSQVYQRLGQLEEPEAAVSWARRALVRRFLDGRRWLSRRPSVPIDAVAIATSDQARPDLIDLRTAVRRLSRSERALLVLHYWQGYSIGECAVELGIPEGTAKSRLSKALGRLRARLKEGDA
ncbi:MAG: RNA polymerase sigma factor [Candidatus Limnocylindria bacterium]